VLARLVKLLLDAIPGRVVDRLRTLPVLAPVLRRVLIVASRPLQGRAVAIARGPAAALLLWTDETSVVWMSGKTELRVQEALAKLVRPGSVFFDIGANIGFFTLLGARLVGPTGFVVAFEPQAENVEKLRRNIDLNELSNVVVVAKAVSDASGDRVLDARHPATATLLADGYGTGTEGFVRVATTSIDDFVAARPDLEPDVVKIDAEGHEIEIVDGMRETLRRTKPLLLCEMHGRDREFGEAVTTAGYLTATLEGVEVPTDVLSSAHVLAAPRGHPALAPPPRSQ
jgi:FkbM family methyltransferase